MYDGTGKNVATLSPYKMFQQVLTLNLVYAHTIGMTYSEHCHLLIVH